MQAVSVRLLPGDDVRKRIDEICAQRNIAAGVILSGVGNLQAVNIRLAGATSTLRRNDAFEIVSLTGTASVSGLHIHVALADTKAAVIGGHLLAGCIVRTTLELVVGVLDDTAFERAHDASTGYGELVVHDLSR